MPADAKPIAFIQLDEKSKKLVVTEEAKKHLSAIKGTVGVCTVAGVYRTGKSYILNQIAGSRNGGFGIGSSVQACTKGIHLWGAPLSMGSHAGSAGTPQNLLLLDTEGLQSICATEGHDAKIFSLAILLSSYFVYNSEKAINNAAIDQLSLVAQLTNRIRVHAEGGSSAAGSSASTAELAKFFPQFVWLLRDFQLELESASGQDMSPSEYLEECLRPQPGSSAAVAEQNSTRSAIRSLFTDRRCIALPHPTLGTSLPPSALKNLPSLDKLHAGFRSGVEELKQSIFGSIQPKTLGGRALTGPMLLRLAEGYVKSLNDGALPTISTAWQAVITLESQRALSEAARLYSDGAKAAAANPSMLDDATWAAEHTRLSASALAHFHSVAVGGDDGGKVEAQLVKAIDDERKRADELLGARSAAACDKLASALSDRFANHARVAAQAPPGGRDATSGMAHSERLPALMGELMASFEEQAKGAGKANARAALLGRLLGGLGEAMGRLDAAALAARTEVAAARTEAEAGGRRAEGLARDLEACRRDVAAARSDASATRQQLDAATAKAADATRATEAVRREADAAMSAHQTTNGRLTCERDAAKHKAELITQDKERLQAELAAAVAAQRVAEGKLADAEARSQRSTDSQGALRSQLSEIADEARELKKQLAAAKAVSAAKATSLEASDAEVARLDALVKTLSAQVVSAEKASAAASAAANAAAANAAASAAANAASNAASNAAANAQPAQPAPAPPAAATSKRVRGGGGRAASRPASATDELAPTAAEAAADEEAAAIAAAAEAATAEEDAAAEPEGLSEVVIVEEDLDGEGGDGTMKKKRRSSVDPKQLAVPALQAKLKALLGPKAKLPKKKADLLALYLEHAE
jgi:predicted  nucleic acid-binding Zn-ribbon protein